MIKRLRIRKALFSFVLTFGILLSAFSQQTLWVGQSYTFDVSSSVMGITANMSWSNNGGYLSLSGTGLYRTITVTQYFSGTATVTCEWDYKLTSSGRYTHTKRQVTISCRDNQVSISPTSMTLSPGESRYVSSRHQYDNQYTSAANAYYQSSDPSICTISPSGEVVAKKPGTAYINVYSKISSVSPYCKVTVQQIAPTSVSLPSSITMTADETRTITPTLYPSNAQTTYSWSSSDTQVATVSSSGTVTAKKHGSAIITVQTANGLSASCIVNISKKKQALTSSHTSGIVTIGTEILLNSSVADATIYYTTDNSAPTAKSNRYTAPIVVNSPTCIKAIATHPDYLDSDILTLDLTTTSLAVTSTLPEQGTLKSAPHLSPCVLFNSNITVGDSFESIICKHNESDLAVSKIIDKNKLYIVPDKNLDGKSISITIPAGAIKNTYGEPNMNICLDFDYSTSQINKVAKFGSQYILYENGDWYIWGQPNKDFPTPDIQVPNSYTPVLVKADIKDAKKEYSKGYYITNDNVLMGWGDNYNDQGPNPDNSILGDGTKYHRNSAVFIADDVKRMEGSWTKGLLKNDGTLWLWGQNRFGQIGKGNGGNLSYALAPVKVLSDVKDFSLGTWHSLALKNDGSVWAWGYNKGIGRSSSAYSPIKIISGNVVEIKAGSCHNIVLKDNGDVYCFGENDYGQIGTGSTSEYTGPYKALSDAIHVYASYFGSYGLKSNGDLYRWGGIGHYSNTSMFTPTKIASDVNEVYVTEDNVFILKSDETLWSMGRNYDGLLGLGYSDSQFRDVFSLVFEDVAKVWALNSKVFVQKRNGSIWAIGSYLGTGNDKTQNSYKPIEFLSFTTVGMQSLSVPDEIVIEVGQNGYIPVTISPIEANHKPFEWWSDNETVATVANGVVQGVAGGEAIIWVSADDYTAKQETKCIVKVIAEDVGIDEIVFSHDESLKIYDTKGLLIYHGLPSECNGLRKGIYIIKQGDRTIKYFKK